MARQSKTGGKASKTKARRTSQATGRKTSRSKRRIAPAATPSKGRSVAKLSKELKEARERQAAAAEILKVINASQGDLTPVFDIILEKATLFCDASFGVLAIYEGDDMHQVVAMRGSPSMLADMLRDPVRLGAETELGRLVRGESFVHVADAADDQGYRLGNPVHRALVDIAGARSYLAVPIRRDDVMLACFTIYRREIRRFSGELIALLQGFAAQAVTAIQNARLFKEVQDRTNSLSQSLQQQTATAEVLKVISRSVFDLQTVLDTLVDSAYKLCGARLGLLYLKSDGAFECKAIAGAGVEEADLLFKGRPIRAGRGTAAERVIMTGEVQSVTDFFADPDFDPKVKEIIRNAAKSGSSIAALRSTLAVPMKRNDAVIGVIAIARSQTGPFPQRQIELLRTFADQAVIAIENARLFDEVQVKTRDLEESLQQQTATADVLKVISRSTSICEPFSKR